MARFRQHACSDSCEKVQIARLFWPLPAFEETEGHVLNLDEVTHQHRERLLSVGGREVPEFVLDALQCLSSGVAAFDHRGQAGSPGCCHFDLSFQVPTWSLLSCGIAVSG